MRTPAVGLPLGAPPSANKRRVPNATISCNFPLPKPPKRWKDVKSYWNIHNGYSDYILDIVVSLTSIFWRVCIYWYQTQSALHRWGGDSGDESEVLMQDTHGLILGYGSIYISVSMPSIDMTQYDMTHDTWHMTPMTYDSYDIALDCTATGTWHYFTLILYMLNNHKQFCSNWLVLNNRIFFAGIQSLQAGYGHGSAVARCVCFGWSWGWMKNDLDTSMGVSEDSVQCNPKLTD